VHVLAAGGWAGSVLAAAVALLPALRGGPDRAGQVRSLLHAFAPLAIGCLTALALTGLLMTGVQVSTVDALLTTPYGLLLLGKLTAVLAAGLLGLRTARRLRAPAADLPRRGLAAEAVALAGVLVLAGTLAAAGPARGPRFPVGAPATAAPEVSGQVADLVDTVAVRPNRPGRNVVTITVSDTRRPAPAPVTGVSVLLTGPDGVRTVHPVTRTGDGWTVTVDDIRSAGDWRVAVTVLRDGLSPVTDNHPWVVPATDVGPTAAVVSSAPLRPAVNALVALVAVGALLAVLVLGRRWLAGRRTEPTPTGAGRDEVTDPTGAGRGGTADRADGTASTDADRDGAADPAGAGVSGSAHGGGAAGPDGPVGPGGAADRAATPVSDAAAEPARASG
jgi:copper transport protein